MASPEFYRGLCSICFDKLRSPARDIDGQQWDVCTGQCAIDAGILEWNILTAAGRSVV